MSRPDDDAERLLSQPKKYQLPYISGGLRIPFGPTPATPPHYVRHKLLASYLLHFVFSLGRLCTITAHPFYPSTLSEKNTTNSETPCAIEDTKVPPSDFASALDFPSGISLF